LSPQLDISSNKNAVLELSGRSSGLPERHDAFEISGLNHAYIWSTEAGRGKGRAGGSGAEWGNGVPDIQYTDPEANPYVVVPNSALNGMTEEEFMDIVMRAATLFLHGRSMGQ